MKEILNRYNSYYQSNTSLGDYYPFGMVMPERNYMSLEYRYGFNGKENDNETETQNYGFRIYNTKIGKFLSEDPLTKKYPELTPYQFSSNNPVLNIDLDGLEGKASTTNTNGTTTSASEYQDPHLRLAPLDFKVPPVPENTQPSNQPKPNQSTQNPSPSSNPTCSTYVPPKIAPSTNMPKGPVPQQLQTTQSTWADNLSESPWMVSRAAYSIMDGLYVTGQNFGIKQIQGKTQPTHLNGTVAVGDESAIAFATTASLFIPLEAPTTKVFWSGGTMNTAANYASSIGGQTLEMTFAGKVMTTVNPFLPRAVSTPIWKGLSTNFAESATGVVHFFPGPIVRPTSIWLTVERPILIDNGIHIVLAP